ncbi:MAG: hypothetical protein ISR83_02915 [Candidatus Marinimicrobia bacterium]|nr:hypothetical protein [Candidatus Neomarinimicrobiota bacterium]
MKINPITEFLVYLSFAIGALLLNQLMHLFIFIPILGLIAFLQKKNISLWLNSIKPFIIYFPILGITFMGVSILFTHMTWEEIIFNFSMATLRLWIMASLMAFYLLSERKVLLITALRSAKLQLGFKGKRGEDFLLFIETILRFLPNIQSEWENVFRGRKSLGFSHAKTRMERIKAFSYELPHFVHNSLRKSDQLTKVMILRGYGKQLPRGVYPYNPLALIDGFIFTFIIISYGILKYYGAI